MSWGFIFKLWGLSAVLQGLHPLLDGLKIPADLAVLIEVVVLTGAVAYMAWAVMSAIEVLRGRRRALR